MLPLVRIFTFFMLFILLVAPDLQIALATPLSNKTNNVHLASDSYQVNTAPTIISINSLYVSLDGAAVTDNVATVSDGQDAAGSLTITVVNAPVGMTVTTTNRNGTIAATVSANCAVLENTYAVRLRVTDSGGLSAETDIQVIVEKFIQLIQDPSFEAGRNNPYWSSGSTMFGTVLCNTACGTGAGTASPRTGDTWAWLGGKSLSEEGFVSQVVDLPPGDAELNFYLWLGQHNGTGANTYFRVLMDTTEIFRITDSTTDYDAGYTLVSIDVTAFAGAQRTLRFEESNPDASSAFNLNLDDVILKSFDPTLCTAPVTVSLDTATQSVAENVGSVTVTANLNRATHQDVTVPFTVGGTATGGGVDHDLANGTITIPAGAQTASVTFNVVDDALHEADETVIVTLGTPTKPHSAQTPRKQSRFRIMTLHHRSLRYGEPERCRKRGHGNDHHNVE